jgi:hypothetical protein
LDDFFALLFAPLLVFLEGIMPPSMHPVAVSVDINSPTTTYPA